MYRENPHKGRVHLPSTLLSERDSEEAKLWAYPSVRAIATSRRKGLSNLEKKRLEQPRKEKAWVWSALFFAQWCAWQQVSALLSGRGAKQNTHTAARCLRLSLLIFAFSSRCTYDRDGREYDHTDCKDYVWSRSFYTSGWRCNLSCTQANELDSFDWVLNWMLTIYAHWGIDRGKISPISVVRASFNELICRTCCYIFPLSLHCSGLRASNHRPRTQWCSSERTRSPDSDCGY